MYLYIYFYGSFNGVEIRGRRENRPEKILFIVNLLSNKNHKENKQRKRQQEKILCKMNNKVKINIDRRMENILEFP